LIDLLTSALLLSQTCLLEMGREARNEVHDSAVVDIATRGDRRVSDVLTGYFRKTGLPCVVLSEESGKVDLCSNPRYTVVIDDIDGTDNFFRGEGLLPYCTIISVLSGLKPAFSDTLAAGIIEHRSGTMWLAEKGKGCLLNGVPAHSSQVRELNRRTLIAIDHYGSSNEISKLAPLHEGAWIKDFGSAGFHLAGVASGMFDAYVTMGQKGHEIAAGYLLITEAGGSLTDLDGYALDAKTFDFDGKYEIIASANQALARLIVAALHSKNFLTSPGGPR
jgi:myo-inositol-1(or 4)-monophosphatase